MKREEGRNQKKKKGGFIIKKHARVRESPGGLTSEKK